MARKRQEGTTPQGPVRYNLYLSNETYDKLLRLKEITGRSSLSDTVRSAIDMYHLIEQVRNGEVSLIGPNEKTAT